MTILENKQTQGKNEFRYKECKQKKKEIKKVKQRMRRNKNPPYRIQLIHVILRHIALEKRRQTHYTTSCSIIPLV